MQTAKIKIVLFRGILPLLLFSGSIVLSAACTKKGEGVTVVPINTIPNNSNVMPDTNAKKYLALGDSYTIGTSVSEADRYPVQTVALLKGFGIAMNNAEIIAANGWTTADLINATNNKKDTLYDAVSLLIGVNNQYQGRSLEEYKTQFTLLLQRSIHFANGKAEHVFVLSIPDYSVTPFASNSNKQQIAMQLDAFNEANRTISATYKVNYLNVTGDSRKAAADPSLVAQDGLHFSGKEYALWANQLAGMMKAVF